MCIKSDKHNLHIVHMQTETRKCRAFFTIRMDLTPLDGVELCFIYTIILVFTAIKFSVGEIICRVRGTIHVLVTHLSTTIHR
jgi:hypothetical protein